jgi:glycosidase
MRKILAIGLIVALYGTGAFGAQGDWLPAKPLDPVVPAAEAAPLPSSISAAPIDRDAWQCVFRYAPATSVSRVALVGSFNAWDREATPMSGPDADGFWTARIRLQTGVYQYKFLADDDDWVTDPLNPERVPDGHGGHNSFVRLGRLAHLEASVASSGDGEIDVGGLAHQPPQALYIQPVSDEEVSIRYRTLARDVEHVWLATRDGSLQEMQVASAGPLFTYWKTRAKVKTSSRRAPDVRGINYTFVLDDGAGQVCDPYGPYYYTLTPASLVSTPDWAKHAVWYQVMLDRFRNGDPANDADPVRPWTSEWFTPSPWEGKDGQTFYKFFAFSRSYGGDIAGLEEKLSYLKDLGITALYLTPVFKAPSYHKYDVQNFIHIDDGFGVLGDYDKVVKQEDLLNPSTWQWTETDRRFLAFLQKAHEMGFKVILDAVFNHVGDQHPAFKDVVRHGKLSRYADWFDVTSWEPFTYRGWAGFAHMPVFKKNLHGFASEGVKRHLFAVTRRWMDPNGDGDPSDGVDGWRLDVPNDIPRTFWAEWRRLVKDINPDALITGEVWQRADQWLDGDHFDAVMNYEFAKTVVQWAFDKEKKIPASAAAARFAELRLAYPSAATYALQNLVSSHDTDRLASMAFNPDREYDRQNRVQDNNPDYKNDKPSAEAYARARLAVLLQATYIGAPLIYYGDEVGMWGADDPSCRKPMLWKDLEPYENPEDNQVMEEHLAFYKQVLALRHAHPALRIGSFAPLVADDGADVLAFLRAGEGECLIVVLNAAGRPGTVRVPLPADVPRKWAVILGGDGQLEAVDGGLSVALPAIGGVVLYASLE